MLSVRDGERELPATLDSLFSQRGVNLELVVVDDGSRDDTRELLAAAALREPRLRSFSQEPLGLTIALARGCAEARAPLIARQDVGDLSHPDRLARQKSVFEQNHEVVLVSCWTACVGPAGEPLYVETKGGMPARPLVISAESRDRVPGVGPSSHGSAVFRRSAYESAGGYRSEFALGQDWDLWYRLGLLGEFWMVGETLYLRKLLPRSLTFGGHDLQVCFAELAREATQLRGSGTDDRPKLEEAAALSARFESERERRLRHSVAHGQYHLGALLRELGDPSASAHLAAAVRRRPWALRAWFRWAQTRLAPRPRREAPGFSSPEAAELVAAVRASRYSIP